MTARKERYMTKAKDIIRVILDDELQTMVSDGVKDKVTDKIIEALHLKNVLMMDVAKLEQSKAVKKGIYNEILL